MVNDNDGGQLLSDDPFWAAVEAGYGPVNPARRNALGKVSLLARAREAYLRGGGDDTKRKALEFAFQALDVAEVGAEEDFARRLARSYRPEPPSWWRDKHRAMFERLRPIQLEALKLFGVDRPIPWERVADHVARLERGVRDCGRSAPLVYPTVDYGGRVDAMGNFETLRSGLAHQGVARKDVWSGLDEADLTLLLEQGTGVRWADDFSYYDEGFAEFLAGSPLYRVAVMESIVVEHSFGCDLREAALFLLCDIVPDAHWIEVHQDIFDPVAPIHIAVPSSEVPPREVAAAYAEHVGAFSLEGRPRTSPKSEWPSLLVAFVLKYRREHGAHSTWAEIHKAWLDEHRDGPVYGTLQSFRNTFNRVNKREEGRTHGERA
jgi:hypothetical protein